MNKIIGFLTVLIITCQAYAQQTESFPYKLGYADFFYVPAGISLYGGGKILENRIETIDKAAILQLDRQTINGFDRLATRKWSENIDRCSDVTLGISWLAPSLVILPELFNKRWSNFATLGLMYFETGILTLSITELTKAWVQRKRPYLYNTNLSIDKRTELAGDKSSYKSFFSGHSSMAFTTAVFCATTYSDIYGRTKLTPFVWAGALGVAGLTAYLRVEAGKHYPSDILVGAAVGSLIGYTVPKLHKIKNENLSVSLSGNYISIVYCLR